MLSQTTSKQNLVTLTLPKAFSPLLSSPHFESRVVGQTFVPNLPKGLGHGIKSTSAKQGKNYHGKVLRTKRIRSSSCG